MTLSFEAALLTHTSSDLCFACAYAQAAIDSLIDCLVQIVEWVAKRIIHFSFYAGYLILSAEVIEEREAYLHRAHQAVALDCRNVSGVPIKVRYIPSQAHAKTGNALVLCLNTTYEDHHPRHWIPFLHTGVDIVLWNPTQALPKIYEEDLFAVLQLLNTRNPHQMIGIKSYCASTDPAISAAARVNFPIPMIIDRGHGDVYSLTRSYSCLAGSALIKKILTEEYACFGIDKIAMLRGKILFFSPTVDQVMDFGERNFTRELAHRLPQETHVMETISGDHWSNWGATTYSLAFHFLKSTGLISVITPVSDLEYPEPPTPSACTRECLPFLMKAWC